MISNTSSPADGIMVLGSSSGLIEMSSLWGEEMSRYSSGSIFSLLDSYLVFTEGQNFVTLWTCPKLPARQKSSSAMAFSPKVNPKSLRAASPLFAAENKIPKTFFFECNIISNSRRGLFLHVPGSASCRYAWPSHVLGLAPVKELCRYFFAPKFPKFSQIIPPAGSRKVCKVSVRK